MALSRILSLYGIKRDFECVTISVLLIAKEEGVWKITYITYILEQPKKNLKLQYLQPHQITWNNMNTIKFEQKER